MFLKDSLAKLTVSTWAAFTIQKRFANFVQALSCLRPFKALVNTFMPITQNVCVVMIQDSRMSLFRTVCWISTNISAKRKKAPVSEFVKVFRYTWKHGLWSSKGCTTDPHRSFFIWLIAVEHAVRCGKLHCFWRSQQRNESRKSVVLRQFVFI